MKLKICDVIKYEGDNSTFVWKSPYEDFNTRSTLIVHESQEALFFKDGHALDLFGAGRYPLKTQNIPLLRLLVNLPTGGVSPFHCEVYFINKTEQMAIPWGVGGIQYMDRHYQLPFTIGASGHVSIHVTDSKKLVVKLVGTETEFTQEHLKEYFRSVVSMRIKSYLAKTMDEARIDLFSLDAHLDELSEALKEKLTQDFADYGIGLSTLNIMAVSKPKEDPNYQRLVRLQANSTLGIQEERVNQQKELIRQQTASQKIVMESAAIARKRQQEGYSYQEEQAFKVADDLVKNEGTGEFSTTGIGLGMISGLGSTIGGTVAGFTQNAFGSVQPFMAMGMPQGAQNTQSAQQSVAQQNAQSTAAQQAAQSTTQQATQQNTQSATTRQAAQSAAQPFAQSTAAQQTAQPTAQQQPLSMEEFKAKVEKLKIMKEAGMIDDEEFNRMRGDLLSQI